ncbi:hypothetical protein EH165_01420 [Nakamurella antarctica]|uniref:Uncharacterized protein n=1 Tax=Nakamurella antarctica TaxID=1902245 RepID=A0A3G8ZSI0_9ACTN|nr:hypothetical protein [Nakamurella antarctica]AZI57026.1 hypothetical protein EH165_01420 [Nakamurella antarctica]
MSRPTSSRWRIVRCSVLAALAAQIAVIGHLFGGGSMPDLAALGAVSVITTAVLTTFARQPRSFMPLFVVMSGAQVLFHLVFTVSSHHDHALHAWPMIAFHLVAAIGSAALLARGETLLFGLFAAVLRRLPRLVTAAQIDIAPSWVVVVSARIASTQQWNLRRARPLRGPPAAV